MAFEIDKLQVEVCVGGGGGGLKWISKNLRDTSRLLVPSIKPEGASTNNQAVKQLANKGSIFNNLKVFRTNSLF